jgi:threonylcarbamoyladenosine tRNA methylthiotransferase MtaB
MHRRYRPWHYAEKLRLIRESMPDAAIGADVMVGFPGESEALFEESFAFIAAQPFTYLHLFPFSPRPGTRAWQLAQESAIDPRVVSRAHGAAAGADRSEKSSGSGSDLWARELPAVSLHTAPGETTQGAYRQFLEVELDARIAANQSVRVLVTGLSPIPV